MTTAYGAAAESCADINGILRQSRHSRRDSNFSGQRTLEIAENRKHLSGSLLTLS
jgi:hypothetical protein